MAKVQKVYTREFKEEAVRLTQTSGKPITQVARELGISDTSIQECAQRVGSTRPRSVSRQRAPDRLGGRKSSPQTRAGASPAGARPDSKKVVSIFSRESK